MHKLSIVIPCYNCEKTLRQTVDSCYVQNLSEDSFEIVMVDDGSQDSTWELMSDIAQEHPNIRILRHEKNRGGGAARNTGIKNAQYEILYCLDSDNFFAPNTVPAMLDTFEIPGTDGGAFAERRFFAGTDAHNYRSARYSVGNRAVILSDLFTKNPVLLDNFFFTRTSYDRTDGYPEHHGFDTQSFEMRWLSAGNAARYAEQPFYHRQMAGDASYFEREYNSGNFSLNYFLCLDDIAPLLSDRALLHLLTFDYTHATMRDNIMTELVSLSEKKDLLYEQSTPRDTRIQNYLAARTAYLSGSYAEALTRYQTCIHEGIVGNTIYYCAIRAIVASENIPRHRIDAATRTRCAALAPRSLTLYKPYHHGIFYSYFNKIRTLWHSRKALKT